ncbi:UBA6 enzyme, partial [Polypterus senegalus]|nr:UBA6 enzyme [Polypterus senegalus]
QFISSDVYGICARIFCDFGDHFEVSDPNGEEVKEIFVQSITKANPGIVTCLENRTHGLQSGQTVTFKEVNGMSELNGNTHQIEVLSPYSFSIGDTSDLEDYTHGGIVCQIKTPKTVCFESLEKQLSNPSCLIADFSKPEAPLQLHAAFLALSKFQEQHQRMPRIGCLQDADIMLKLTEDVNMSLMNKAVVNEELVRWFSRSARGSLPPLAAAVGGIASQEVLKALTGKFSPLQQWLYFDAIEVVKGTETVSCEEFFPRGDRYDALRACVGEIMCQKLHRLKVFLVGCGAIGCEMLKNFALLGVSLSGKSGEIIITDPDLIEKSNLNRQFLFRPHHIQKPKSTTAAAATLEINPQVKINARLNKVCPATENIYSDEFYSKLDVVVTALDNVEARRYIDSVSNQRPLLDSGTMGTKGHTEVIVPNLTESYNSHRDPPEEEIPFCTLKSFPAVIEHTIQWARDKFESLFTHKPSIYNKFWQMHSSVEQVLQRMKSRESLEGSFQVIKLLSRRPAQWEDCVLLARFKFEKYFKRKAVQLLHSFPIDTRLKDGSLFWQSPKRPPSPIEFEFKDELHFNFIVSAARLFATVYNISYTQKDVSPASIIQILSEVQIPNYTPVEKKIETDENAKKPDHIKLNVSSEEEREAINLLERAISNNTVSKEHLQTTPILFEKDDDSNGHIDFITAASNLRARMYSIESADRFRTKRIAGKIIPAIATATAAVSGLFRFRVSTNSLAVYISTNNILMARWRICRGRDGERDVWNNGKSWEQGDVIGEMRKEPGRLVVEQGVAVELLKIIAGYGFDSFRNCFFNLALPIIVFTKPAEVRRTQIREGISFSIWDRWTIHGKEDFTLSDFINAVQEKYGIEPTMVVYGVKMLYVPVMPGHNKRLKLAMQKLIKPSSEKKYVDLTVSFPPESDGDEDLPGPPVRYHFSQEDN